MTGRELSEALRSGRRVYGTMVVAPCPRWPGIARAAGLDFVFIDTPPSLGLLTLNALAAADDILIPLQPHFLALQGLGKLLQTVELVNRRINPDLKVKWILLCMFDSRSSLPNEVKANIEQFLHNARGTNCAWAQAGMLPVYVRRNIKLAEAPGYGKTIFEYEQNCHGAEDYRNVAEYIHAQSQGTDKLVVEQPIAAPKNLGIPIVAVNLPPQADLQRPALDPVQTTVCQQQPQSPQ
jgi:chromosome partitioning protein